MKGRKRVKVFFFLNFFRMLQASGFIVFLSLLEGTEH